MRLRYEAFARESREPAWRKQNSTWSLILKNLRCCEPQMATERNKSCFSNSAFVLWNGSDQKRQPIDANGMPLMKSENFTQYLIRRTNRDRHLSFDPSITKTHQPSIWLILDTHPTKEEHYSKTTSALIIYNRHSDE